MFCVVKVKNDFSFFGFHFSLFTFRKTFFPGKPKNSFFRMALTVRRTAVNMAWHSGNFIHLSALLSTITQHHL